jgi:hypothetical protein
VKDDGTSEGEVSQTESAAGRWKSQSARPILHDLQKQDSRKLLVRHTARRGLLSPELAPHIDPAAEDGVIPSPRPALVLDFDYARTR